MQEKNVEGSVDVTSIIRSSRIELENQGKVNT